MANFPLCTITKAPASERASPIIDLYLHYIQPPSISMRVRLERKVERNSLLCYLTTSAHVPNDVSQLSLSMTHFVLDCCSQPVALKLDQCQQQTQMNEYDQYRRAQGVDRGDPLLLSKWDYVSPVADQPRSGVH